MPKSIKVKKSSSFGIFFSVKKVNITVFSIFPHFLLKYAWAHGARIFSSHYTTLKFTESNNDSHNSSAGRSLQHGVSGHTKQRGWLRLSDLVQTWSSCPAVPLSFNDNWYILCFFLLLHFGMKTLIYQTQATGVVGRVSGRQKWDGSYFFFLSHFSPTGSCSTGLPKKVANKHIN